MPLTKQSLLQRVPDLDVALRSNTDITLTLHGRITDGDLHTLAILDTFATPKTLQDGVNELTARGIVQEIFTAYLFAQRPHYLKRIEALRTVQLQI